MRLRRVAHARRDTMRRRSPRPHATPTTPPGPRAPVERARAEENDPAGEEIRSADVAPRSLDRTLQAALWVLAAALGLALMWWSDRGVAGSTLKNSVGPWGRMERVIVNLEQPPNNFVPAACFTDPTPWALPGHTRATARELFASSGLDGGRVIELVEAARCDGRGCVVTPTPQLTASLSSEVRGRLYARLGRHPENAPQAFPFSRPESEDRWRDLTDLVDPALLARLSWRRGDQVHLSDLHLLCAAARTDDDRVRILETLSRMTAVMAWLVIDQGADINALTAYWGRGTRSRNLRPIFEALARVPGGARLDVLNVLPPFARRRVNTFAHPDDPPRDCYWTALNFFALNQPADVFVDGAGAEAILARDYARVPWEERSFGDVILFVVPGSGAVHAANHVADDLVFTKNGRHARRPWSLAPLSEVRDAYPDATELRAYRLRAYPQPARAVTAGAAAPGDGRSP